MNRKSIAALAALAALPVLLAAGGDAPALRFSTPTQDLVYGVSRFRVWTVVKQLATANTVYSIPATTSGTTEACIPWDAQVVLRPDGGKAACVFSMSPDVSIGALTAEAQSTVTDPFGPDGEGAVVKAPDGIAVTQVPRFEDLYRLPGARAGLCSVPAQLGKALGLRRRACRSYSTVATATVSVTSNVATVTANSHGLVVGQRITIAGISTPLTTASPILTTADANTLTVALAASNGTMADGAGTITVVPCPTAEGTCDTTATYQEIREQGCATLRCEGGTNSEFIEVGVEK